MKHCTQLSSLNLMFFTTKAVSVKLCLQEKPINMKESYKYLCFTKFLNKYCFVCVRD